MSERINPHAKNTVAGARYLGSIDSITAANWAKECGAAIGSAEFNAYAKRQLNSGEYSKFKADVNYGLH